MDNEIRKQIELFQKERIKLISNKKDYAPLKYTVELSKILRNVEEYFNAKIDSKTDKNLIEKINNERKNILIELGKELYAQKNYVNCILADKKLLKIDVNYHLSYVRLFHCFCNIDEPDNGVIYGQMIKGKYDKAFLDKHYPGLLDEINDKTDYVIKNYKYFSYFRDLKITPKLVFKGICFIICCAILIYGFINKLRNK